MNDDESPRRQPFTWGLRPSGARGPGAGRESVKRGDNG
ncbi:MAG: hypothetical protein JWM51_1992, partial [Microbacteriaceae bacterium]|nr:hypothetical protein [Microbacteriaceae bacterium]